MAWAQDIKLLFMVHHNKFIANSHAPQNQPDQSFCIKKQKSKIENEICQSLYPQNIRTKLYDNIYWIGAENLCVNKQDHQPWV